MIVYLDTSTILRRLFNEPGVIRDWGKWDEAHSSRIWKTEASRAIHRLRLEASISDQDIAALQADIALIDEALHIIPVSEAILTRAGEPFPTIVGTLDAIHLASAISVDAGNRLDTFLTHDKQQATAARGLGLNTEGCQGA